MPVRPDLRYSYISTWNHFARPGPTLTGTQRIGLLAATRADITEQEATNLGLDKSLGWLSDTLYHNPANVDGAMVRTAADATSDPATVGVIAIVSMLSSIDGMHRALGAELEPLPDPHSGAPTGEIRGDLKRRRTHVPAPPGSIALTLDLLPSEGAAFQSLFGPQYMTGREMAFDTFLRSPGLNRAQMELVSSRTSIHNECFY